MRRVVLIVAALAFFAASAHFGIAQIGVMDGGAPKPKAYVLYAAEVQAVPSGKLAELALRFHVVQGMHVNSHTPKSPLLIPTALTLQPANGVKAGDLEYPAGHLFSFSFDPSDKVDVYSDDFVVKLPVVATPGEHTIEATLKYQACDNASCYPPRTVPIKVLFTAK